MRTWEVTHSHPCWVITEFQQTPVCLESFGLDGRVVSRGTPALTDAGAAWSEFGKEAENGRVGGGRHDGGGHHWHGSSSIQPATLSGLADLGLGPEPGCLPSISTGWALGCSFLCHQDPWGGKRWFTTTSHPEGRLCSWRLSQAHHDRCIHHMS